jgi:hypothetical protein
MASRIRSATFAALLILPNASSVAHRLRLLLLFLLVSILRGVAQPHAVKTSALRPAVVRAGLLPDRNYSWNRIRTDTTLVFGPADSLRPALAQRYWLKLAVSNQSRYTESCQLTVLPALDNKLFYFDEDARAWLTQRAGVEVATDSQRLKGPLPLRLLGHTTTTCYVLVDLGQRTTLPAAIHLQINLEKEIVGRKADRLYDITWAMSLAVLFLLLLTTVHAYVRLRDRTTLCIISGHR